MFRSKPATQLVRLSPTTFPVLKQAPNLVLSGHFEVITETGGKNGYDSVTAIADSRRILLMGIGKALNALEF